jgi:hypothetical protein
MISNAKSLGRIGISICAFLLLAVSTDGQRPDQLLKAAGTPVNPKVSIAWNRYYDSEALAELCRKIAKAYPRLAKLQSIGKSGDGRDIWCLTTTDFNKGKPDRKPAMYVQGNIHGNEIQGGEYSLYIAWYLTESFGDVKYIQDLLAEKVFYIVPTINPDSRDYFIHKPTTSSDPRGYNVEQFEPRFHDLDGDGNIVLMRWKDPKGIWRIDPNDPRRMVPLQEADIKGSQTGERIAEAPDERNYSMAIEGDTDKLGMDEKYYEAHMRVGTDFIGMFPTRFDSYDPNRNWDWNWESGGKDAGGSIGQPFSFSETRSVRDFFLQHTNIVTALSFHNSAGAIYTGTVKKPEADNGETDDEFDMGRLYDEMGKHGEELLPGYRYVPQKNGGLHREVDWMYGKRGAYSFLVELMPQYLLYNTPESKIMGSVNPGDVIEDERSRFSKDLLFEDGFVPWRPFDHPKLGKVEIGGFKKTYADLRLTPGFLMESEAHRNMAFCLYLASETPKLEVRDITVKDRSDGLQEVTATIINTRLMPTHSGPDLKHNITRPDYVTLQTAGRVVAAMEMNADRKIVAKQKEKPERYELANIPGNSTITVSWIVEGKGPYTVVVDSVRGGTISDYTK